MREVREENPGSLPALINDVFRLGGDNLIPVMEHAGSFARLIDKIDPFIQKNTEEVCPQCRQVCCINRHSYHTHFDVIYLLALGEEIPFHKTGIADSEPCQFLSTQGCILRRVLRPYRCTWYFCTPLLEHIINAPPVRQYRDFISCLEQISGKRELLLAAFMETARKAGISVDIPPHEFY